MRLALLALALLSAVATARAVSQAVGHGRQLTTTPLVTQQQQPDVFSLPKTVLFNKTAFGNRKGTSSLPLSDPRLTRSTPPDEPEQVHITYADPSTLLVTWVTGNPDVGHDPQLPDTSTADSQVRYRPTAAAGKGRSQPYQTNGGSASAYRQFYYGSLDYNGTSPAQNYTSGIISTAYMPGLEPDTEYDYQVGDATTGIFSSKVYHVKTLPLAGPSTFPFPIGLIADLGDTANSSTTLDHLAASKPIVILNIGDLVYADEHYTNDSLLLYTADLNVTNQQRWDAWGRFTEPVFSKVPHVSVPGNHEIDYQSDGTKFASYSHRYPMGNTVSGSPTNQYFSLDMGPAHVLVLSSYIPFFQDSPQYAWLLNDLKNNFDRQRTPWLIATFHAPVFNTYLTHYKENECFRQMYEPLFFEYGVDAAFSGHVHAYERSQPVYNYQLNGCGTTYITIGDGGNTEQLNTTFVNYTAAACPVPGGTHKQPWYQPEFCPSFFDRRG